MIECFSPEAFKDLITCRNAETFVPRLDDDFCFGFIGALVSVCVCQERFWFWFPLFPPARFSFTALRCDFRVVLEDVRLSTGKAKQHSWIQDKRVSDGETFQSFLLLWFENRLRRAAGEPTREPSSSWMTTSCGFILFVFTFFFFFTFQSEIKAECLQSESSLKATDTLNEAAGEERFKVIMSAFVKHFVKVTEAGLTGGLWDKWTAVSRVLSLQTLSEVRC